MAPSRDKMERTRKRREMVMQMIEALGGSARPEDLIREVDLKGLEIPDSTLRLDLGVLADRKSLIKTPDHRYWIPTMLIVDPDAPIAMSIFGTSVKGRVVNAMANDPTLTGPKSITARINKTGTKVKIGTVTQDLHQLRRDGFAKLISGRTTVLTDKAFQALGRRFREVAETHVRESIRLRHLVVAHLDKYGPTHKTVFRKTYLQEDTRDARYPLNRALRWLTTNGIARTVKPELYVRTDKPFRPVIKVEAKAPAAVAFPLTAESLSVPCLQHLVDNGATRVATLIDRYGGPDFAALKSAFNRTMRQLRRNGYARQLWKGVFAATDKRHPQVDYSGTKTVTDLDVCSILHLRMKVFRHFDEHGLTKVSSLMRQYADPASPDDIWEIRSTIVFGREKGLIAHGGSKGLYVPTAKLRPFIRTLEPRRPTSDHVAT